MAVPAPTIRARDPAEADLVDEHLAAAVVHALVLEPGVERERTDYMAMELLYQTDAFEHLTDEHFLCHGLRLPSTLIDLLGDDSRGGPWFLWDARHVSLA